MSYDHRQLPADLVDVAVRLRELRCEASPAQLDRIKHVAEARASRRLPTRTPAGMRGRLATTGMLVVGFLLSGTGATLAVSGLSDSGSAGTAQYEQPGGQPLIPPAQPPPVVRGEQVPPAAAPEVPSLVVPEALPEAPQAVAPGGEVERERELIQPTAQLERGGPGGELPFTGFVAVPVLIAGLALLVTGVALRRRTS